jgi:hypothetical protein
MNSRTEAHIDEIVAMCDGDSRATMGWVERIAYIRNRGTIQNWPEHLRASLESYWANLVRNVHYVSDVVSR